MSEELNLGAAAEEEGWRTGGEGAAAAGGRRIGFLIPFSLSQKKSPRNGEVVKRDFAAAATEVDILGLAGKAFHHYDQDGRVAWIAQNTE